MTNSLELIMLVLAENTFVMYIEFLVSHAYMCVYELPFIVAWTEGYFPDGFICHLILCLISENGAIH